jgi:hypothetical protein
MTKIDVVAQATYPVPITYGRHLFPGEIARRIERTPEIEAQLKLGFLRETQPLPETIPEKENTPRKPRAELARDENQE